MQSNDASRQESTATNCPWGRPECDGVSGLFFGEISCWECYRLAPQNARDAQHVVSARARTGAEHPALAGD